MKEICPLIAVISCAALIGVSIKLTKIKKELRYARAEIESINCKADRLYSETRSLPERMFDKDGNEYMKLDCEFGGVFYSKVNNGLSLS